MYIIIILINNIFDYFIHSHCSTKTIVRIFLHKTIKMTERTPTETLQSDQGLLPSTSSHIFKVSRHQLTQNHVR